MKRLEIGRKEGDSASSGDNVGDEQLHKRFQGFLILNWNTGGMRVTKKELKKVKPYEIPIKIDCTINIPENPEIVAKGEFDIPPTKVQEMFLDMV